MGATHHGSDASLPGFGQAEPAPEVPTRRRPVAARMRPRNLSEVVGHAALLGPNALLPRLIKADNFGSLLFYGPPGCGKTTLAEVIAAENLGAKMIKLFPGNILGMEFMQAIRELFPNLLFMPTGGVDTTKENIEGWFKSGVCAVGMGSKLVTKSVMENKQYEELIAATTQVLAIIQACKK